MTLAMEMASSETVNWLLADRAYALIAGRFQFGSPISIYDA